MSEDTTTLIPVREAVRAIAGEYARRRGMNKGTVARYINGGADEEPIVQYLARAFEAGVDNAPYETVAQTIDATTGTLTINGVSVADIEQENEQLKNQLADAGSEIVVLKTEIADLKRSLENADADHIAVVGKLAAQLVATQTVIYNVRLRLNGSWFNRAKDITKLVRDIDISNRQNVSNVAEEFKS